ncbi:MAG: PEP-CTERM sorting domain-containing protein [Rubrivivax sp.]
MRHLLAMALCLATLLAPDRAARAEVLASVNGGGGALNQSNTGPVFAQASGALNDGNFAIQGQSYGSLATGAMGLKVAATPFVPLLSGPVGSAAVDLWDTLRISGPGTAPVLVTFTLELDAALYFNPLQGSQAARMFLGANFGFGGINERGIEVERAQSKDENGAVTVDTIQCWGSCSGFNQPLTTAGVIDATLQFTALLSQSINLPFHARLQGNVYTSIGAVGVVDALNTAQLSVSLPAGYTLSSASGAFLTSPVPEPSSWTLMLLGAAAICRHRTRRLS